MQLLKLNKMEVGIYPGVEELAQRVSDEMIQQVIGKKSSVICLASGDTPKRAYEIFVQTIINQSVSLAEVLFVGLDEWLGIDQTNTGSCYSFFEERIVKPLGLPEDQFARFDALATDSREQCFAMDRLIESRGGIDLMIVGIGMNGHIGFNEPGSSWTSATHVVSLDETTQTVGQKYFQQKTEVSKGITLGLGQVMTSRKLILMASGERKAGIIQKTLQWPISEDLPATIVRRHPQSMVLLDRQAAGML